MTHSQDQVAQLMRAVAAMTNAVKVATDTALSGPSRKLPPSDLAALMFVGANPGARVSDLAEALRMGLTTASSVADRLVTRDLLGRERSDTDRRAVGLVLAPKGQTLFDEAVKEAEETCRTMLSALDEAERGPFVSAMEKIAKRFERSNTSIE